MPTSSKSSVLDCRRPGNTPIRRFKAPSHTQVPNEIFDELMHDLSGAEFKVLCYIARRTYGFHRIEDSISLKQICEGILTRDGRRLDNGTGLARSTAVIAIRGLVSRGLILAARSRDASTPPGQGERFDVNRYRIVVDEGDECREDGPEHGLKIGPPLVRKSNYSSAGIEPGGSPKIELPQNKVNTKESPESSSSSSDAEAPLESTEHGGNSEPHTTGGENEAASPTALADVLLGWAEDRGVVRVRSDRTIGLPDDGRISVWGKICKRRGISAPDDVYALLDFAKACADRNREPWQAWKFLDLQVGIAAESFRPSAAPPVASPPICGVSVVDEASEWSQAKALIRQRISEIAFQNWFADSWQIERCGDTLMVGIPDVPTREFLNMEYSEPVQQALAALGIPRVEYVVAEKRGLRPGFVEPTRVGSPGPHPMQVGIS